MNKFFWNLKARYFKLFRSHFPFENILNQENSNLVALINTVETEEKIILDLGVGTGNVLQFFNSGKRVLGIDVTYSMLLEAREKFPKVKFVQADVLYIPLKSNSIDIITSVGLIEYVKETILFFEESCRILKKGGYLILTFSPSNFWTGMRLLLGHPIYTRTLDQLKGIVKLCNFQIIDYQQSIMQHQVLLQKSIE